MKLLYHGSNVEVTKPCLIQGRRQLDFGQGFYLTSDYEQARRWSERTVLRREEGQPTVTVFEIDEGAYANLSVLSFDKPDEAWLQYVTSHRKNIALPDDTWDVVTGPVANDQTITTIGLYLRGMITAKMAIELLLPQNLKDQYTFRTEKALQALLCKEVMR